MEIMKEIDVIISCKCVVPIEFETRATEEYELTEKELEEIYKQALDEYNPSLEYDYTFEEIESIVDLGGENNG